MMLELRNPQYLQRGEKRILVELPGLKDPERIKALIRKNCTIKF
jgi:preprotein translocase subunit SecD